VPKTETIICLTLCRFDAERLSNDLPVVEALEWDQKIAEGFAPGATYDNGQEFPMRPDNVKFRDLPTITVQDMKIVEGRIRDAIASSFVKTVGLCCMESADTSQSCKLIHVICTDCS
jgi:hypothetical protein